MPTTHVVTIPDETVYHVTKNGVARPAHVLSRHDNQALVHYINTDKRLDEWVSEDIVALAPAPRPSPHPSSLPLPLSGEVIGPAEMRTTPALSGPGQPGLPDAPTPSTSSTSNGHTTGDPPTLGKRKRGRPARQQSTAASALSVSSPTPGPSATPALEAGSSASASVSLQSEQPTPQPREVVMTEEDYDIQHHKQITAQRNFDKVHFGEWQVKTWYFSPYPLTDTELDEPPPASTSASSTPKIPGVQKATARSHGRTSDLLAGGLGRNYAGAEKPSLWVCQQCFKYMADGNSYDLHLKYCTVDYPPGRRVYQRGAHSIWEVDGAKQKLYCQNLSLFGKLFIDVKTLFFDCDNFLFYILTDSTSKQDHMLGYFSKEKVSYDDYNLACIMTLPPYQRRGYGMLMIEFSYELSRRAGKVGTPERPLSDLGLRSYLAYWVSTLIRFFRQVLSTVPPDVKKITTFGGFPGIVRSPSGDSEVTTPGTSSVPPSSVNGNGIVAGAGSGYLTGNGTGGMGNGNGVPKKKKKPKGWAGEVEDPNLDLDDLPLVQVDAEDPPLIEPVPTADPMFTTRRVFETTPREDGGAETHVSVRCTLADIARATNLRVEDAAFALNEVGMLVSRAAGVDGVGKEEVVITRELVEKVATERNVKRPCMRMAFVRL
ncbi:putative MOZ/SAS family protein [Lyophyllum shimeji]|uniref:histone acetyltransferase n=1 Tax=Lyophyllum shimeji TaxID=47721 RepID=A0A9P3UMW3_LYOSH|nr:putative MOZ/SAS family protein [Lyophyllum shimeji]